MSWLSLHAPAFILGIPAAAAALLASGPRRVISCS